MRKSALGVADTIVSTVSSVAVGVPSAVNVPSAVTISPLPTKLLSGLCPITLAVASINPLLPLLIVPTSQVKVCAPVVGLIAMLEPAVLQAGGIPVHSWSEEMVAVKTVLLASPLLTA